MFRKVLSKCRDVNDISMVHGFGSFVGILWISSFYGPFMGLFRSCVCYAFVSVCLYVSCGHLLGKG